MLLRALTALRPFAIARQGAFIKASGFMGRGEKMLRVGSQLRLEAKHRFSGMAQDLRKLVFFQRSTKKLHLNEPLVTNRVDLGQEGREGEMSRAEQATILFIGWRFIGIGKVNQADAVAMFLEPLGPMWVLTDVVAIKDQFDEGIVELLDPFNHLAERVRDRPSRARCRVHRL